jgi:transposase
MMIRKRSFTKEFKEDAVRLLRSSGRPCAHVAKDLGISEGSLRTWNNKIDEENPFPGKGNPRDKEIFELRKEISILKEEREILKKAMAIFSQENQ